MSPESAQIVRASWSRLQGHEERVAVGFYTRLFTLEPELRHLFVLTDMESQRDKLVATLELILRHLDDPVLLRGQVRASAQRHTTYGVGLHEYRLGGEALLWSLGRELGQDFTPEVQGAWAEAYTLLADLMLREGAR